MEVLNDLWQKWLTFSSSFTVMDYISLFTSATWFSFLFLWSVGTLFGWRGKVKVVVENNDRTTQYLTEALKYTTSDALNAVRDVVTSFNTKDRPSCDDCDE